MEKFIQIKTKLQFCTECNTVFTMIGGHGDCRCDKRFMFNDGKEIILSLPVRVLIENFVHVSTGQLEKLFDSCKHTIELMEEAMPELREEDNGTDD